MEAITNILNKFGQNSVDIIRSNMATTGTNASGQTSEEVKSDMIKPNRNQVSGPAHIYVVEDGRKPGKMPPLSKIESWLRSGKVSIEGTIDQAKWAIGMAISKKGSKLFQEGGRKDIITPIFDRSRFDRLNKDIANAQFNKVANAFTNDR